MSRLKEQPPKHLSPLLRGLLLGVGMIAVVLGVLGIFLPVLPTVPFLLLAVACFARSSERFYQWLIEHAHLGPMVRPYLEGRGLKRASRRKAIALVWISILLSISLLGGNSWLQLVLAIIAIGVTVYLLQLPLAEDSREA